MQDMFTFVKVVEEGSFTSAAKALGMPKSTVSRQVARLEDRLGVRLLHRTTRSLRLSDAGQAYYERARRIVSDIKEAEEAVSSLQATPRGTLRISAPMQDNQPYLGEIVSSFMGAYPEVQVHVHVTNRIVDMVDEGFDVAIRGGVLKDSSLIARKLGSSRRLLVASPAYLEARGEPKTASELPKHAVLAYQPDGARLRGVPLTPRLLANNMEILRRCAIADQGVAYLPELLVSEDISEGRLIEVLHEAKARPGGLYIVYPHNRHLSAKVRAFVDHTIAFLKDRW
jgi:DNA-binding transcriptional LysR family regulator